MSIRSIALCAVAVPSFASVILTATPSLPQQLPTGGAVTHGAATIGAPQAGTLNINQTSNRAIIDWSSFSVGAGGRVNFNQPGASAATLNRVTGTTSSTIAGAITAPGTVLLVNPNGIAITPTGTVNVGSFAASTLDIKNSDFLAGNYKFTGNGSSAVVTNAGRINVSDGGFAALLGGRVANDGIISARLGRVGLGSGEKITLDISGDGFLQVEVPSNQLGNIVDGTGQALVSNRGKIRANGGIVHLSAATASNILRDAVNVPGSIRANSVGTRGGRIVLGGGNGGRVTVSGRVSATGTRTARRAPGNGGSIDISGAEIALVGARLNASGATGGGRIRIGGDAQGSGDFPHAQSVSIDSASVIKVDATEAGNGGTVIVWSDGHTQATGTFSARGGAFSGDGGLIETSGHSVDFTGIRINASASRGKGGEWLIDPVNLLIDSNAASTIMSVLEGGSNVTLVTTATIASGLGVQSAGNGDIQVASAIVWNSGSVLTLSAYGRIDINATVSGANGGLVLQAQGGVEILSAVNFGRNGSVTSGGIIGLSQFSASGNLTIYAGTNLYLNDNIFMNGGTLSLVSGNNATGAGTIFIASGKTISTSGRVEFFYNPSGGYGNPFSYAPYVTGGGSSSVSYMLVNNASNLNSVRNFPSGNYGLVTNINVGDFTPIGGPFTGEFNGRGWTIDMSKARVVGQATNTGLFVEIGQTGIVRNLGVSLRTSAIESEYTGAIAGINRGLIIDSAASVTTNRVEGFQFSSPYLGGVVGANYGTISNVVGTLDGNGNGYRAFGGIAALNFGSIANSSATVSGVTEASAGGIAGRNEAGATITSSSARGSLGQSRSAEVSLGGLVGTNGGTISGSYAAVNSSLEDSRPGAYLGGFVGVNSGTISGSLAVGSVSGSQTEGGFVGHNVGLISHSVAMGPVLYRGGSLAGMGGFVGTQVAPGTIEYSIAVGHVDSVTFHDGGCSCDRLYSGGFVGRAAGTFINSYYDTTTTGMTTSFGHSGASMGLGSPTGQAAAIQSASSSLPNYAFSRSTYSAAFLNTMYMSDGYFRPVPIALRSYNIGAGLNDATLNAIQLQLVDSDLAGNYRMAYGVDMNAVGFSLWSSLGFAPIGSLSTGGFSGTFDGQGQAISNLNLNRPNSAGVGLFTVIESGGTVRNLGLVGGSVSGVQLVGSLAGYNLGTIQNVYSTVSVNGRNNVGGLVGSNQGTISNAYTTGDVNGNVAGGFSAGVTGGIGALNFGTISNVYSTGTVTGASNGTSAGGSATGGIVGFNTGTIQNAIVSGTVTGVVNVGAIVGINSTQDFDSNFIPITVNGIVRNGFWNTDTTSFGATGDGTGTVTDGGGLSTGQMYDLNNFRTNFAGLNFDSVWTPPNQGGQGGDTTNTWNLPQLAALTNVVWVEAAATSRSYGSANPAFTTTLHGLDYTTPRLWSISGLSLASAATTTSGVGQYAITSGTPSFGGYRFVTTGTLTVIPKVLNGSAVLAGINKTYDGTTDAAGGSVALSAANGVLNGDSVTVSAASGTYSSANAGSRTVTINGLSLNNGNYAIGSLTATGSGTIAQQTLTVSLVGSTTRAYDGTTLASLTSANYGSLSGVIGSDAVSLASMPSSGTYNSASVGNNRTVTVNGLSLTGAGAGNYTIASTASAAIGFITPRALTITAGDQSKTYGDTAALSAFGSTGLVTGESIGSVTLTSGGAAASANVTGSPYAITASNATGGNFNASNYAINYVAGSLTVTPASVVVTAVGGSSVYGATPANPGLSATGLRNGESATVLTGLSNSFGIGPTTGVAGGPYTLNVAGTLTNPNYQVTTRNIGSWTVTPASVVVTALGGTSVYGASPTNPGLSASGLQNGEDLSVLAGLTNTFGITSTTGVAGGPYALNVGGVLSNPNYQATRVSGAWTVTPASIVVTALGGTSTYGANPTNPGLSASGLQNGEDVGVLAGLSNSFGIGPTSSVAGGPYALNVAGVLSNQNYQVTMRNNGVWTVTPASVVVTANGGTSVYGSTPANPGLSAIGLQNGEDVSVLAGLSNSFGIGPTNSVAGGPYTLNVAGVLTNQNYQVSTRNSGVWNITPASVVVTALGGTSVYGASPLNPGLSATGLQNGEDISVLTGLTNTFGITSTTGVAGGPYALNVGGTLANQNYQVTRVSGAWNVTPASVVVTALGGTSVYGANPLNPGLSATGLQNGEGIAVLTGLANSFGITNLSNAGNYTVRAAGTLTNPNYSISARNEGIWAVNPAHIIVAAHGGRSTYGQSPTDPGFSATGLQNGESVGVLTGLTNAFGINGLTNAGSHTLRVAGALGNSNYVIDNRVAGLWTVDRAALTVAANPQSRLVTELDPLLTYRISSGQLFNGDGFSGELARDRGDAPGNYAITQGSLAASSNYALTYVGSTFEIRALASEGPSQGRPNGPTTQGGGTGSSPGGGTTTISFQPVSTPPVTFGSSNPGSSGTTNSSRSTSTIAPTTIAAVNPVNPVNPTDPVVTATVNATERVLTYLPISQFEAQEYSTRTLPGYEDRTGEATVLTMIARAIAGERTSTLFIDNFWSTSANNNAGATEFDLIAQRVTFSDGRGKETNPGKDEPFPLQNNDPAKLLQGGPLMIVAVGANGARSWMLAIRMTEDGKGIVANDPVTGRQVILSYDPETRLVGGVTRVLDPKSDSWIAIDNAEALKAAGLEQFTAERVASLQSFAPTGYLAVGVN